MTDPRNFWGEILLCKKTPPLSFFAEDKTHKKQRKAWLQVPRKMKNTFILPMSAGESGVFHEAEIYEGRQS